MPPAQSPVQPGQILAGKYRVDRIIGVGGMGVVVAATHLDLAEERAIKFMLPSALSDMEAVDRFLREARAASRLKSEHVARVHDVGRLENGAPYMVMECLAGTDLSARLKREGALHFQEAIVYVLQAIEALAEAHAGGIIHRDLKPANLFLAAQPDGTAIVKVLDFGISKLVGPTGSESDLTRTDVVLGSPNYMSPEQMNSSRDVDPRADIWSLGVILYQLVTGRLPFRGSGITEIVAQVLQGAVAPPSQLQPGLPAPLDAVILCCLERDLGRRFPTVVDLAQALGPFVPAVAPYYLERITRIAAATPPGFLRATGNLLPLVTPAQPLTPRPALLAAHPLTPQPALLAAQPSGTGTFGATASPSPARGRALPVAIVGVVALMLGAGLSYFGLQRAPAPLAAAPPISEPVSAVSVAAPAPATASATSSAAASASASAPKGASASAPVASASAIAAASAPPPARAPKADPFGAGRK